MIKNLREMSIYESLHDHVIIPYQIRDYGWDCQVFYYSKASNEVYDQGIYQYDNNGVCFNDKSKNHNIVKQTATQNLHPKLKKAVVEWKKLYKGNTR